MTSNTPSETRLDRLEALAETVLLAIQQQSGQIAEQSGQITQQGAQIAEQSRQIIQQGAQIAEHSTQITQQSAQIAEHSTQITQQGAQIAENSAQIAKNSAQIAEESIQIAAFRSGISEVVAMLSEQAEQQDIRHTEAEQRFENLLQDARADRQRIDEALARGDRDRALNESEHRAFRETFQTLLAEVARIWQQLAG